jgi:hypothetical protein
MNKGQENIDDLLRRSLGDYKKEPSPGVWRNITIGLGLFHRGFYLIIAAFIIAVLSGIYIFRETPKDNITSRFEDSNIALPSNNISNKSGHAEDLNTMQEDKINFNTSSSKPDIVSSSEPQIRDEKFTIENINPSEVINAVEIKNEEDKVIAVQQNYFNIYPGIERLYFPEASQTSRQGLSFHPEFSLNAIPEIEFRNQYFNIPLTLKDDYGKPGNWLFGVFISPELIFLKGENNSTKKSLGFDLAAIYLLKEWYLQFGAGVALTDDKSSYQIDYAQYDSLGYYYKVNSFSIDPVTEKPVFNTSVEGVYDTVLYNKTSASENLYTYLRLPLFAGINVYEFNRFSIFLKAGGIYSILINSNEPGVNYENDQATWIKITDNTPKRIQSFWQLSLGLDLNYRLSNRITLQFEPYYNYYLQPLYEKRVQTKAPYSLGLKAGMLFKF